MLIKNSEIYNYAMQLAEAFQDKDQKLPIKINFALQKNKQILIQAAQEIEQARLDILEKYGKKNLETNQYHIEPENIENASKELEDLANIEQDLGLLMIKCKDLDDSIYLSACQMEALMFMIK